MYATTILAVLWLAPGVSTSPSSSWCTGAEYAPVCPDHENARCQAKHADLPVGTTETFNLSCNESVPIYCSFIQFKTFHGSISVHVPGTFELERGLIPNADDAHPESENSGCFEVPSRRTNLSSAPLLMKRFFDPNSRPSVVSSIDFELTCGAAQSHAADTPPLPTTPPPPTTSCLYAANIQCSCGLPAPTTAGPRNTVTVTVTATATAASTGQHSSPSRPPAHKSSSGPAIDNHTVKIIVTVLVVTVLAVITVFGIWLRKQMPKLRQQRSILRKRRLRAGAKLEITAFKMEEDVAMLGVANGDTDDEDFIITGMEDDTVWRLDAEGKAVCNSRPPSPEPVATETNSTFTATLAPASPLSSSAAIGFVKRFDPTTGAALVTMPTPPPTPPLCATPPQTPRRPHGHHHRLARRLASIAATDPRLRLARPASATRSPEPQRREHPLASVRGLDVGERDGNAGPPPQQ